MRSRLNHKQWQTNKIRNRVSNMEVQRINQTLPSFRSSFQFSSAEKFQQKLIYRSQMILDNLFLISFAISQSKSYVSSYKDSLNPEIHADSKWESQVFLMFFFFWSSFYTRILFFICAYMWSFILFLFKERRSYYFEKIYQFPVDRLDSRKER